LSLVGFPSLNVIDYFWGLLSVSRPLCNRLIIMLLYALHAARAAPSFRWPEKKGRRKGACGPAWCPRCFQSAGPVLPGSLKTMGSGRWGSLVEARPHCGTACSTKGYRYPMVSVCFIQYVRYADCSHSASIGNRRRRVPLCNNRVQSCNDRVPLCNNQAKTVG
jgi:hypothetical protein